MRTWIFILLAGLLSACTQEDALTPSEVKNWYVIIPTDNMDEVDSKIYELYEKYNLAVFYKDTIGSEDRGWKDENGNPKLYYEILNLGYDMSVGTNVIGNTFKSTPLDVSTPEKKAKILPLLELMDKTLFAWIENAQVFIPAVLIVENMRKSYTNTSEGDPQYVYRGMSALGIAMESYSQPNTDSLIQRTFLQQVCYGALQDQLSTFQMVATSGLETSGIAKDKANKCWGIQVDDLVSLYSNYRSNLELMEGQKTTVDSYKARNAEIDELLKDESLSAEERTKLETERSQNQTIIEILEKNLSNYDEYKAVVTANDPRNFGFLDYTKGSSESKWFYPTMEKDFNDYLECLWEYDEMEFKELYKDYPYVQARYTLIRQTLETLGFDIERIKADLAKN